MCKIFRQAEAAFLQSEHPFGPDPRACRPVFYILCLRGGCWTRSKPHNRLYDKFFQVLTKTRRRSENKSRPRPCFNLFFHVPDGLEYLPTARLLDLARHKMWLNPSRDELQLRGRQSRPKPRGGSKLSSSEKSNSQIARKESAVALSARFGSSASSHA